MVSLSGGPSAEARRGGERASPEGGALGVEPTGSLSMAATATRIRATA